ncbi:hypothetical protein B0H14DRAFT_3441136 [Mycena olivaceomarginata]|nr:hypothetical protein B0H14DRAFT_3441136 [Mycena olivaceomarginata]
MASVTPFNAAATLGTFEISALVSYALLGLTITQTYIYFRRFPDDSLKIKALVAFVCLSEVAHAICLGHALYALTISDYGQPEHVFIAPRSLPALIFLSGLVAASDKIILLGSRSKGLLIALWSVAAVNDLTTVTTTLLVILVRERSNAYKRTVALLNKPIMYTIESGILISASSIATLICLVAMKDNLIWLAVFAISVRFISNSLLASLNSRATLRGMNQVSSSSSISTLALRRRRPAALQILPSATLFAAAFFFVSTLLRASANHAA